MKSSVSISINALFAKRKKGIFAKLARIQLKYFPLKLKIQLGAQFAESFTTENVSQVEYVNARMKIDLTN